MSQPPTERPEASSGGVTSTDFGPATISSATASQNGTATRVPTTSTEGSKPAQGPTAEGSAPRAAAGTGTASSPSATTALPRPGASDRPTTAVPQPGAPAAPGRPPLGGPTGVPGAAHSGASTATTAGPSRVGRSRGPRRARLQLRHINPWTVLKFSCVLAIALFFVWLIVVGLLYGLFEAAGIIGKINDAFSSVSGPGSSGPIGPGVVFGGAAILGVINVVLFIAMSTLGSVIYNLCADLVGGVEVTLSEA